MKRTKGDAMEQVFTDETQILYRAKIAQDLGRAATRLENEVYRLRINRGEIMTEPVLAPEGSTFTIQVAIHEGNLIIQRLADQETNSYGLAYDTHSDDYESAVQRSGWGDDTRIEGIDTIAFEAGSSSPHNDHLWGYDTTRGLRVLIDHNVHVRLSEAAHSL